MSYAKIYKNWWNAAWLNTIIFKLDIIYPSEPLVSIQTYLPLGHKHITTVKLIYSAKISIVCCLGLHRHLHVWFVASFIQNILYCNNRMKEIFQFSFPGLSILCFCEYLPGVLLGINIIKQIIVHTNTFLSIQSNIWSKEKYWSKITWGFEE